MEVNIHHAKTNLSKLIAAVESGEEVIIARNGKPVVKLVLATPPVRKSRKHILTHDAHFQTYPIKVIW